LQEGGILWPRSYEKERITMAQKTGVKSGPVSIAIRKFCGKRGTIQMSRFKRDTWGQNKMHLPGNFKKIWEETLFAKAFTRVQGGETERRTEKCFNGRLAAFSTRTGHVCWTEKSELQKEKWARKNRKKDQKQEAKGTWAKQGKSWRVIDFQGHKRKSKTTSSEKRSIPVRWGEVQRQNGIQIKRIILNKSRTGQLLPNQARLKGKYEL